MREKDMSKYDKLAAHFATVSGNSWHATFEDIERIIGFSLPASARSYQAWWANSQDMPHKLSWQNAGWRTKDLNIAAGHIMFVRDLDGGIVGPKKTKQRPLPHGEAVQIATDTPHPWDLPRTLMCAMGLSWLPIGKISTGMDGKLNFPKARSAPAIYCFRVRQDGVERRYVGQTDNLMRRFSNYRNPGTTQQTNLRLNDEFKRLLTQGAEIAVSVITEGAWIDWGAGAADAEMTSLAVRCLLENAAIVESNATEIESLNRGSCA